MQKSAFRTAVTDQGLLNVGVGDGVAGIKISEWGGDSISNFYTYAKNRQEKQNKFQNKWPLEDIRNFHLNCIQIYNIETVAI